MKEKLLRTFSGNFTNKDLRDDPTDRPFRRGISSLQQKSRNDAQQQVANLQKQFQNKSSYMCEIKDCCH